MEVEGRRPGKNGVPFCQPCADTGNSVTADKFCSVCKDWLCVTCIEYHRRFKSTRIHNLLDQDLVSNSTQEKKKENTIYYCEAHPTELIKYYCPTHDTLHCGDCAASLSCKMDKLSSITNQIGNKDMLKELQTYIGQLIKSTDALESKVCTLIESAVETGVSHLDQVTRHEQGLIEKIKAHSASLKDDINIATSEAEYQLGSVIDVCTDIKSVGKQLGDDLNECIGNDSEVFIACVKAKAVLESKSDELIVAGNQTNVKQYIFKKCVDIETILQTTKSFGTYEEDLEELQTSQSTGRPHVHQQTEASGCYYVHIHKFSCHKYNQYKLMDNLKY